MRKSTSALLGDIESKFQKAQGFLRMKDEEAEKAGEPLTVRLLRKAAKSFGTNVVFSADRNGVEDTLDRILRAYLILDPREAHTLATWYVVKQAEGKDAGAMALVDAARMLTTNPSRPVWPMMGTPEGIERRYDASERLLRLAILHPNRNISNREVYGVIAGSFVDSGLMPQDACMALVLAVEAERDGGKVADATGQEDGGETGVEVEGTPEAPAETGTPAEQPAAASETPAEEPAKPKRESNKQRKAREAAEAAAAKDPAAGLTGHKPKKDDGVAGLEDLNLG